MNTYVVFTYQTDITDFLRPRLNFFYPLILDPHLLVGDVKFIETHTDGGNFMKTLYIEKF